MSEPDLTQTQSVERGWVMLFGADQITAVYGHQAFLNTLRAGGNDIRPRISGRRALYVLAEPDGVVRAACAFTIGFDNTGSVQRDFSLPLRELALRSGDGADLGWGRIRLACACQCARPEYEDQLWGDRAWDLLPALVDAQRLLREESRFQAQGLRKLAATAIGAPARSTNTAVSTAEDAFGAAGVLSPEQLARGRDLASQELALSPPHDLPSTPAATDRAGGQPSFTADEVRVLRAQDRRKLIRLDREVAMLRRRLGTVLES